MTFISFTLPILLDQLLQTPYRCPCLPLLMNPIRRTWLVSTRWRANNDELGLLEIKVSGVETTPLNKWVRLISTYYRHKSLKLYPTPESLLEKSKCSSASQQRPSKLSCSTWYCSNPSKYRLLQILSVSSILTLVPQLQYYANESLYEFPASFMSSQSQPFRHENMVGVTHSHTCSLHVTWTYLQTLCVPMNDKDNSGVSFCMCTTYICFLPLSKSSWQHILKVMIAKWRQIYH